MPRRHKFPSLPLAAAAVSLGAERIRAGAAAHPAQPDGETPPG